MTRQLAQWIADVALVLGLAIVAAASAGQLAPPSKSGQALPPFVSIAVTGDYELTDFVIALSESGRVELLHPRDGRWMATIGVASNPMVVRRPSTNQLLISDSVSTQLADDTFESRTRLLVFDLAGRVAFVREIELPGRSHYLSYTPGFMELSGDQRFLFYYRRAEPTVCCQNEWATVDLEARDPRPVSVAGDRPTCGTHVTPGPGGAATIACGFAYEDIRFVAVSFESTLISGDGRVLSRERFEGAGLPFTLADGRAGVLRRDGRVETRDSSGEAVRSRALPVGVSLTMHAWIGAERLLLGYRAVGLEQSVLDGFSVFDFGTLEMTHYAAVDALSVAPRGDRAGAWLLHDDGTISAVTFEAGGRVTMQPLGNATLFRPRDPLNDDYEWQRWALIP